MVWSVLLALTILSNPAEAYPGEAAGWEGVRWGDSAQALFKQRPGLRRRGYRLGAIRTALRKSDGGVFVDETVEAYGWDEAVVRWEIRKSGGVFQAIVDLEDLSPMSSLSPRKVLAALEEAHGPSGEDREGNRVWPGESTVIVYTRHRVVSGAHVVVTHVRRSEWDEVPVDLPAGWGRVEAATKPAAPPKEPVDRSVEAATAAAAAKAPSVADEAKTPEASPEAAQPTPARDAEPRLKTDEADRLLDPSNE